MFNFLKIVTNLHALLMNFSKIIDWFFLTQFFFKETF